MAIACSMSAFKMPPAEALVKIKSLGFSHVDLIAIKGFGHFLPSEIAADWAKEADRIQRMLAESRLTPVAMNVAVGHLYDRRDATANAQRRREVEAVARVMRRLNIGVASFYPGYRTDRPWEDVLKDEVATLREMLAVAAEHGVRFAVELHFATPFERVDQSVRLLDALPELGVAYDPSHFAMQGIDLRATAPLLDRAIHVHVRSAAPGKMQAPVDEGTVDFDWMLGALKARGYPGHFAIEYLHDAKADMTADILKTRDIVARYFPASP